MKTKFSIGKLVSAVVAGVVLSGACTPMDHYYKDLIELGDRVYAGKVTDVLVRPGQHRVRLVWNNPSDPSVTRVIAYWNNYRDSVGVDINRSGTQDSLLIDNLDEERYVVNMVTMDAAGNRSLPVELTAQAYGDRYQETLRNRVISNVAMFTDSVTVFWNEEFQET